VACKCEISQCSTCRKAETFYRRPTSTPGTTQRGADMLTCPPALTVRSSTQSLYRLSSGLPASAIVTYILPLSRLSPASRHGYCSSARSQLNISLCPPSTAPSIPPLFPFSQQLPHDAPFRFPGFFLYFFVGRCARGKRNRVMTHASRGVLSVLAVFGFRKFPPAIGPQILHTVLVSLAQRGARWNSLPHRK